MSCLFYKWYEIKRVFFSQLEKKITRTATSGAKRIVYKIQTLTDNVLQEPRVNPGLWTRTVRDLLATIVLLTILSLSPKENPFVGLLS